MLKVLSKPVANENDLLSLTLDQIARAGAKKLLAHALELEVEEYIQKNQNLLKDNGHRLVTRNGRGKARKVTVGSGTIEIQCPRVNDEREGHKFESTILPPYMRKSPNVESVLPLLYLKGLSGNEFYSALSGLLGENAGGLSSASICALKKIWEREYDLWASRKISDEYVYVYADGVNVSVRLGEDKRACLLVLIGVNSRGEKELLACQGGYRESALSWKEIFLDLLARGMKAPLVIVGDGGLGLWAAIGELEEFKNVREQRCWFHKMGNVLDKMPKKVQPQAKSLLQEMANAEKKGDANDLLKKFKDLYESKYEKAHECLSKDWKELTTFFDFPAKHWRHLRTTNPIESSFATVKHRLNQTKGAGKVKMAEIMSFKLLLEAEKRWKKIRGAEEIKFLLEGALYRDGELVSVSGKRRLAA